MPISFEGDKPKDKKTRPRASSYAWYNASKDNKLDVARELFRWIQANEVFTWPRRYQHLLAYRYMTGRPTNPAFHFSVGARPGAVSQWYGRTTWQPPVFNAMAQADDVLANRVYKNRPFLQVCPIAGDHNARNKSVYLTRWIDATFYDFKLWDLIEICGGDSRMWGTGYLLIDEGAKKNIAVTRVIDDEVILDETEANLTDNPRTLAVRLFMHRQEVMASYGTNDDARRAIEDAPSANVGIYFGADLDVSDVICLASAWHLGSPTKKKGKAENGRHVVAVGNYALLDETYDRDHFPLAKLPYKKMTSGWRGQGLAEQVMGLQREIERCMSAYWENIRRMSWPKVGIEASSNVNEAALGDRSGGTFKYTKTLPEFFTPTAITKDQFEWLQTLVRMVRERTGISDQAANTQRPASGMSGLAIEKQSMVDDGRHVELMLHLQDFVEQIGVLLVEAAERCKPTVTLPGRNIQQIKWEDVCIERDSYSLRAFPMSNMPQSIAGRQQYIDTLFSRGSISRATQMRLEQIPDIDGFFDLVNASKDSIEMTLDEMVEKGKYVPPEPWGDLKDALATAQSRYLFEKKQKTPQKYLNMILRYMSAIEEMLPDIAPGGFGVGPTPGMPGAPPVDVNAPVPDVAAQAMPPAA